MSHLLHDRRSLALGQAVAARLREDPQGIAVARRNLRRWLALPDNSSAQTAALEEWSALLDCLSVEEIAALLASDSPEAARLRQNSPFAGLLTSREVWALKRTSRHAHR